MLFLNFHLVKNYITQLGKKTFFECYGTVVTDLVDNLDTEKIFRNESFSLFEFLITNSIYRLPNEDRYALMMVQESNFHNSWFKLASALSSLEEDSLNKILKFMVIDLKAFENEAFQYELDCLSNGWAIDLFVYKNHHEGKNLFFSFCEFMGIFRVSEIPDLSVTIPKELESFCNSNIIYTSFTPIFNHINFLLLVVLILIKQTKSDKWKNCYSECIQVLKKYKMPLDNNIKYACVNLGVQKLLSTDIMLN